MVLEHILASVLGLAFLQKRALQVWEVLLALPVLEVAPSWLEQVPVELHLQISNGQFRQRNWEHQTKQEPEQQEFPVLPQVHREVGESLRLGLAWLEGWAEKTRWNSLKVKWVLLKSVWQVLEVEPSLVSWLQQWTDWSFLEVTEVVQEQPVEFEELVGVGVPEEPEEPVEAVEAVEVVEPEGFEEELPEPALTEPSVEVQTAWGQEPCFGISL